MPTIGCPPSCFSNPNIRPGPLKCYRSILSGLLPGLLPGFLTAAIAASESEIIKDPSILWCLPPSHLHACQFALLSCSYFLAGDCPLYVSVLVSCPDVIYPRSEINQRRIDRSLGTRSLFPVHTTPTGSRSDVRSYLLLSLHLQISPTCLLPLHG